LSIWDSILASRNQNYFYKLLIRKIDSKGYGKGVTDRPVIGELISQPIPKNQIQRIYKITAYM
jgi:hypothetical protein